LASERWPLSKYERLEGMLLIPDFQVAEEETPRNKYSELKHLSNYTKKHQTRFC